MRAWRALQRAALGLTRLRRRLACSFLIPGRPEDLSHSNICEGRMTTFKTSEELEGRPICEAVLKMTGNKNAHDGVGKQGFMEIDTEARASNACVPRGGT